MNKVLRMYSPECYFCNPETGERGWTIEFPSVPATSKANAADIIMNMPFFDCFIEYDWDGFNHDGTVFVQF